MTQIVPNQFPVNVSRRRRHKENEHKIRVTLKRRSRKSNVIKKQKQQADKNHMLKRRKRDYP